MKLWKRLVVPSCILLSMLTFVYLLPENSFWCMDEGNRYLQTWSLSHGLHLPPELPYPGSERISDPELVETLKPLPAHFGYLLGRCELYSQYNPLLALTAVPSHMLLGQRGIYIPCILAGAILAYLMALALRKSNLSFTQRMLLVVLCTPIPFFMVTFFSHTIALSLAIGSALLLRRQRYISAFVLASIALVFREEMILSYPMLVLCMDRKPSFLRIVIACAAAAAVFLVLQRLLTGNWLGTHVSASGWQQDVYRLNMTWLQARLYIARRAFINAFPGFGWEGLVLGLGIWAAWALTLVTRGRPSHSFTYAGLMLSAVPLIAILARGLISLDVMDVQHPLVIFPILWLAKPPRRFLITGGAVILAMILLMSPMHTEDVAWGFRHALLQFLMLAFFIRKAVPVRLYASVLVIGLLATTTSLSVLTAKRVRSESLIQALRANGSVVVTTSWQQPQDLASMIADGFPVLNAPSTHSVYSAITLFGDQNPLVVVRRGSSDLLFETAEAAGMRCDLIWSGVNVDPLANVLVFRCQYR